MKDQSILEYELLNTLEFTSTRKRMSVILRDRQSSQILLLCKGADSIIKARLDPNDNETGKFMRLTQTHVDAFANEGLRTLLLAKKKIDESYYQEWNMKFQLALGQVIGKDEKINALNEEVETGLKLVGATAIEDKLQEEVQETIVAFKQAGIKVWVLTGDKVETAINVGFAAGLLNSQMV